MTEQPQRCLRVGCSAARAVPDRLGLGLCEQHSAQTIDRTIGADQDPTVREHPIADAREIITRIRRPGESIRGLARRIGMPKDVLWHVLRGSFAHIRSEAWEALQDAEADILFAATHQTPQESGPLDPQDVETLTSGTGVQLALFDLSDAL